MTTPPQPPKLTISRAPAPAVLSWNRTPTPLPRYAYGRIIADCVDCGEETWWLRGRSADGGNSVSLDVATGRYYRLGCLLSNDPDLPIPDEPRCHDCTAYRALPYAGSGDTHDPAHDHRAAAARLEQPPRDDYPVVIPTPMTVYVPDHEDETVGFRHPSARTRKEE